MPWTLLQRMFVLILSDPIRMLPTTYCRFFQVALCVWVGVCSTVAPVAQRLQTSSMQQCGGMKCGCCGDACGCSSVVVETKCCTNANRMWGAEIQMVQFTDVQPILSAPNGRADFHLAVSCALICDCGCQRPLPLPEMPASVAESAWSLVLCREYVQCHCYPFDLKQYESSDQRDGFASHSLVSLISSERRQAALSRWQI